MTFPNTSDSYKQLSLTLDNLLIEHPSATYFARVSGNAMAGKGILHDSLLIVDRSLSPKVGDVVLANIDDEFLVRIYQVVSGKIYLFAANNKYKAIKINSRKSFVIWGVVINCINSYRRPLEW